MSIALPEVIRIGTRQSKLALAQTAQACAALRPHLPAGCHLETVPMLTTGDRITDRPLADIGGKGLFAKELDEALLLGQIDMAVHSMKDIESFINSNISISSVLIRENNCDAMTSFCHASFAQLPPGARLGTSSVRRAAQALAWRPDLTILPLRGNVPTRLRKLEEGEADAALLAVAGLKRLGLEDRITETLEREHFLPAACQGIIGITSRRDDAGMHALLAQINHAETFTASLAERALLATLDGSCRTPIAAWARMEGGQLRLTGALYAPDGSTHYRAERQGSPDEAPQLGTDAGEELKHRGAHLLP